jgi:hypothetical protein
MKKLMMLIGLCVWSMATQAADYQYLVFTMTDGSTKAVTATNLSIAFSDGYLLASSGEEALATLPLASLTQMEFSNEGTTGIQSISVNQLVTDSNTVIYDLNGRQMPSTAQLPKGVYILKNNNRTLKVNIK